MSTCSELSALPEWLQSAFAARGFAEPTPIQSAVLDPELRGRDLQISSATGSGKTIALSAVLGETLMAPPPSRFDSSQAADAASSHAVETDADLDVDVDVDADAPRHTRGADRSKPTVLVIAPTRELATQLAKELRALYGPLGLRVALVLGGGSYRQEHAALKAGPDVLVATPGRLVDHLQREQVDLSGVGAVALDEADQLLALGFKDELDAILEACPAERRTIMVSATFIGPVKALARRHQRDAVRIEGTPVDAPHADIEHVGHLVRPQDQLPAICNLLLMCGDERCLIFVATRAQVNELGQALSQRGFRSGALSGEMTQAERARALESFRRGRTHVLVATDVAARGIDVDGVRLVIHASPPRDTEALIHRSGRTGRAGQQGRSVQLLRPSDLRRVQRIFQRAGLELDMQPVPSPRTIEAAFAERTADRLARTGNDASDAPTPDASGHNGHTADERGPGQGPQTPDASQLMQALLARMPMEALLERLVQDLRATMPCEPAHIEPLTPRGPAGRQAGRHAFQRDARGPSQRDGGPGFAMFEVTYGAQAGATPQRVMAMVCRRGRVQRRHIGHIDVGEQMTRVEVDDRMAANFARSASEPDSRDRNVHIRPVGGGPARRGKFPPKDHGDKRSSNKHGGNKPPRRKPRPGKPNKANKPHKPHRKGKGSAAQGAPASLGS